MLTKEDLIKYVTYDPVTGYFLSNGCKYSNKNKGDRVGCLHKTKGYRYVVVKGKTYREQRAAFLYMTGSWPVNQVDHINGIKDDNRWVNLRDVPPIENSKNRGLWRTNISGYKGVCWNKSVNKWQVLCRYNGKQIYKGVYKDVHEAGMVAKMTYEIMHAEVEGDGYASSLF